MLLKSRYMTLVIPITYTTYDYYTATRAMK